MSVRAKFNCTEKKADEHDDSIVYVRFEAVVDEDGDNAQWSKWTPSGSVAMAITNPAAHNEFEVGKSYFLDFSPAQ